jgi:ribosomal protein L40E
MSDDEHENGPPVQPPPLGDTPPEGFAAVQAPVRVCRHCSTQSQTAGTFCPHCGTPFVRPKRFGRLRGSQRRTKIIAAALAALLIAASASGVVLKQRHDDQIAAEKKDKAEKAAQAEADRQAVAEQQRQDAADAQTAKDSIERDSRKELERGLRKEVKKDAEEKVASGLLEGPILSASCDPVGGGREDLTASTGKYDCIAIHTLNDDGTARGYQYTGTINYDDFTYTWQLSG